MSALGDAAGAGARLPVAAHVAASADWSDSSDGLDPGSDLFGGRSVGTGSGFQSRITLMILRERPIGEGVEDPWHE